MIFGSRRANKGNQLQMLIILGAALALSGAAGLINQVVWQRSLKFLLGGGEALSSTIVILVFMIGLGFGSWCCGRQMKKISDPLKVFIVLEVLLGGGNLLVSWALSRDLSSSIFWVHDVASAIGLSLYFIYAFGAFVLLFIPCFLMGATMPLAAEVCQRRLGCGSSKVIGVLLAVNTFGSVCGALVAGSIMMPVLGLQTSLDIGATLNILGGMLLLAILMRNKTSSLSSDPNKKGEGKTGSKRLLMTGCWAILVLSFCSLGYEMYLFRLFALNFLPLPQTFAAVITGFLFFWSLGAALSAKAVGLLSLNLLLKEL